MREKRMTKEEQDKFDKEFGDMSRRDGIESENIKECCGTKN